MSEETEAPPFEVFEERFKPILNPNELKQGNETVLFETYGADLEFVQSADQTKVWTLVECDGDLFIAPGVHFVNRQNFIITELPIVDYMQDYVYWLETDMDACN
jgi:hypothetical protein